MPCSCDVMYRHQLLPTALVRQRTGSVSCMAMRMIARKT